jgi:uncharacterized protein (UPF0332 family)
MTNENRIANAVEERRFAERFLDAARGLASLGMWDRAVPQLYYCLLHSARALLCTEGLDPRSHRAARSLLALHFVRPGLLAPSAARALAQLQDEREDADYLPQFRADEAFYRTYEVQSLDALAAMDAVLRQRGVVV